MKTILFFLLLVAGIGLHAQTCIIIHVSSTGITAGADRLYHETLSGGSNQDARHRVYFAKKIFRSGQVCWALSGADYYDSIHAITRQVCAVGKTLRQTALAVTKRLKTERLKKAMQGLLQASDAAQKKKFRGNMTEIAFFGYEGKIYKAYRLTVSMPGVDNGNESLRVETDSIVAGRKTYGLFVLGHYDAFDKNNKHMDWLHPVSAIRRIIREQAAITPADVGATADVIRIVKGKAVWLK